MRENFRIWTWQRFVFVYLMIPLGLAVTGPFGTFDAMEFPRRLFYWFALVLGIGLLMQVSIRYTLNNQRENFQSVLGRVLAGSALAAVPGSVLVVIADVWIRMSDRGTGFMEMIELWFHVWIMGVAISLMEMARLYVSNTDDPAVGDILPPVPVRRETPAPSVREMGSTLPRTPLHARFQSQAGAPEDIISLSMQDHYVEVTTTTGVHLVLMRMRDAVRELEPLPGMKIHRSHWISEKHLRDLHKSGNRWFAVLSDGRELPVSQTFLEDATQTLDCVRSRSGQEA